MTAQTDPESDLCAYLIRFDEQLASGNGVAFSQSSNEVSGSSEKIERLQWCLQLLETDRRLRTRSSLSSTNRPVRRRLPEPDELADESGSLNPDHVIGRFQLQRRLGSGGFGVVFLARDPVLNRMVAIKVPRPETLASPAFHKRFVRESRFVARLSHPCIVPIFEAGQEGPISFQVMAYCGGGTLSQWLRSPQRAANQRIRGPSDGGYACSAPVDASVVVELLIKLAEAVQYAHLQGILHRDLKPSNILLSTPEDNSISASSVAESTEDEILTRGHRPMVADFGLARIFSCQGEVDEEQGSESCSHSVEGEGLSANACEQKLNPDLKKSALTELAGTFLYMAPEQLQQNRELIGPATDVWGLGTILYEMLTGTPPFSTADGDRRFPATRAVHVTPPRTLSSGIPYDLEAICLKCLSPKPGDRYADVQILLDDLRRYSRGEPVIARPGSFPEQFVRWVQRRPAIASLLAFCSLLLATLFFLGIWHLDQLTKLNRELVHTAAERERLAREAQSASARSADLAWLAQQREYAASMVQASDALKRRDFLQMNESLQRFISHDGASGRTGFDWRYLWNQGRALRPWNGHTDDVISGCPGVNHTDFFTFGVDGTIRKWDIRSGKQQQLWELPENGRRHVAAFSNRAERVVICRSLESRGVDETSVRDLTTGRVVRQCQHMLHDVHACDISLDGEFAVIAGRHFVDGNYLPFVDVLNPDSGVRHSDSASFARITVDGQILEAHSVGAIALLPESDEMIFALTIPDTKWGYQLARCTVDRSFSDGLNSGHSLFSSLSAIGSRQTGIPDSVILSSDGNSAAVLVSDGPDCVDLWDLNDESLIRRTESLSEPPDTAAFSHDGKSIAIATDLPKSAENTESSAGLHLLQNTRRQRVTVQDLRTGREIQQSEPTARDITFLTSVETEVGIGWVIGEAGGAVSLWSPDVEDLRVRLPGHGPSEAWSVAFSPDGRLLYSGGDDHALRSWDVGQGTAGRFSSDRSQLVSCVAVSPDSRWIAAGGYDDLVMIHDAHSIDVTHRLVSHQHDVRAVAFSPDGSRLASAGRDRLIRLWSVPDFVPAGSLNGHQDTVRALQWLSDGRLVSADSDGQIRIHDLEGRLLQNHIEPEGVHALAAAPSGLRIPVGADPAAVPAGANQSGSAATGESANNRMTMIAEADELIAIGTRHGKIKVWHLPTDSIRMEYHYPGVEIRSLKFSPDGRLLAAGGDDQSVHVRHVATNREVLTFDQLGSPVNCISFSPDGTKLVAAMHDGSIRIWAAPVPGF